MTDQVDGVMTKMCGFVEIQDAGLVFRVKQAQLDPVNRVVALDIVQE